MSSEHLFRFLFIFATNLWASYYPWFTNEEAGSERCIFQGQKQVYGWVRSWTQVSLTPNLNSPCYLSVHSFTHSLIQSFVQQIYFDLYLMTKSNHIISEFLFTLSNLILQIPQMTLNSVGSSFVIIFSVLSGFHLGDQISNLRFRTLGVWVCAQSLSRVRLFATPGCNLPGFSVHGILQSRILGWVAISYSGGFSWPRDQNCISCTGKWILYYWATREAPRTLGRMFKDHPVQTSIFLVKETEVQWFFEVVSFPFQYILGMSSVYLNLLGVLRSNDCVL